MEQSGGDPSGKSLREKLARGGAWAVIGKGGTLALNFVTIVMVARMLDKTVTDAYVLALSVVTGAAMVGRLDLDNTVVYLVSSAVGKGNPGGARRAIRTVMVLGALGIAVTSAVLSLGGASLLGRSLFHSELVAGIGLAMGLWTAGFAVQLLVAEAFRGLHAIREAALFGGTVAGALTVLGLGALWGLGQVSLGAAAWVTTASTLLAAASASVALFFRTARLGPVAPPAGYLAGDVLRSSLPVLVSNVMTFVLTNVGLWVVAVYLPAGDAAVYGTVSRLVNLIGVSFMISNQVLPPVIGELAARGDRALMERTLRGTAFAVGLPGFAALAVFFLAGRLVLRLTFGAAYEDGAIVLVILSIGQVANLVTGSSLFALLMTGNGVAAMWISGISGAAATAACIVAARSWGIAGVAAAMSGVIVLQQLATLLAARRLAGVWTHASASAFTGEVRRLLRARRG